MDIIFDQFILNLIFLEWISCEHQDSFKAYEHINQLQENPLENLRQSFECWEVYLISALSLKVSNDRLFTVRNYSKLE